MLAPEVGKEVGVSWGGLAIVTCQLRRWEGKARHGMVCAVDI